MEHRLIQQQTQRLILSPQIRQYLKILQMPVLELRQAVEQEMADNPMLEESAAAREEGVNQTPEDKTGPENGAEELQFENTFDKLAELDENLREQVDYDDLSQRDTGQSQSARDFQESLITRPEALSDYLLWQLRFLDIDDKRKAVCEEIIGNIDEDGYFKSSVEDMAVSCGESQALVGECLRTVQEFEPPGTGARDLREALLLQLERKGQEARLAYDIVLNHIKLVEKRDMKQLTRIYSVEEASVRAALAIIARLEPKPGRIFYSEESNAVVPDAEISFIDGNPEKIRIDVFDESVPRLRLNNYYRKLLRLKDTDAKTKVFLREKMQHALNFMRALKLRKSTLRDITETIVKAQPEFFEKGFAHLRPLRLKDIANSLGIHESTVSRALQNKYILTPQGMIPYRSFFSTKLETHNGESESQKSIMERIRDLVDKENSTKPLSDQEIVKLLGDQGIKIARRTVAKYRDILKILPSHLRRRN